MKKIISLFVIITMLPFVANAEIASKAYVDDQDEKLIMGTFTEQMDSRLRQRGWSEQQIQQIKSTMPDAGLYGVYVSNYDLLREYGESLDEKQGKLGGGSSAGKVVTATNTSGDIRYTAIDSTPTAESANLVSSGGVAAAIASAVSSATYDDTALAGRVTTIEGKIDDALSTSQTQSGVLVSDNGNVKITNGGYIEDQHIKTTAGIQMGKIAFPTPPAACETAGCMLMYVNGQYTWEKITRDNSETVSVVAANSVNATATGTNSTGTNAESVSSD